MTGTEFKPETLDLTPLASVPLIRALLATVSATVEAGGTPVVVLEYDKDKGAVRWMSSDSKRLTTIRFQLGLANKITDEARAIIRCLSDGPAQFVAVRVADCKTFASSKGYARLQGTTLRASGDLLHQVENKARREAPWPRPEDRDTGGFRARLLAEGPRPQEVTTLTFADMTALATISKALRWRGSADAHAWVQTVPSGPGAFARWEAHHLADVTLPGNVTIAVDAAMIAASMHADA